MLTFMLMFKLASPTWFMSDTSRPHVCYTVSGRTAISHTYDSRAFREAFYKYDFTRDLAGHSDDRSRKRVSEKMIRSIG